MANNVAWARCCPLRQTAKTQDLRYLIKVVATELGATQACGVPGKDVNFKFGDTALYPPLKWDNRRSDRTRPEHPTVRKAEVKAEVEAKAERKTSRRLRKS